ncbi:MAG: glycosyltransferase family 2 protein [Bacteroidales bacterium]|nr:glycosyltransferase family 2 protein [Candidatus Scybalousia scybalohippi]
MISFLIPIYNFNIVKLIQDLVQQSLDLGIEYEVLAYDDCSTTLSIKEENKEIHILPNVKYVLLEENLGRSKIRNHLAKESKGDVLLFLDCDSGIVRNDFVQKYIEAIKHSDVVVGGTVYNKKESIQREFLLHWTNGKNREEGKKHFTTNNFCIKKSVFQSIQFSSNLTGYGHEDTIFGCELAKRKHSISFIDNPVAHLGLKNTSKFIADTIHACENLAKLYTNPQYKDFLSNISLVKAFEKLQSFHLVKIYSFCFTLIKAICIRQIMSNKPNLKLLDLLKLHSFCKAINKTI